VEVWDGAAWVPTHYDSGWRTVTGLVNSELPTVFATVTMRRTLDSVELIGVNDTTTPNTESIHALILLALPAGFHGRTRESGLYPTEGFVYDEYDGSYFGRIYVESTVNLRFSGTLTGKRPSFCIRFPAQDPLPNSLPGTLTPL
jgi:hypothetical protein